MNSSSSGSESSSSTDSGSSDDDSASGSQSGISWFNTNAVNAGLQVVSEIVATM